MQEDKEKERGNIYYVTASRCKPALVPSPPTNRRDQIQQPRKVLSPYNEGGTKHRDVDGSELGDLRRRPKEG